jgi:hypothetical protein
MKKGGLEMEEEDVCYQKARQMGKTGALVTEQLRKEMNRDLYGGGFAPRNKMVFEDDGTRIYPISMRPPPEAEKADGEVIEALEGSVEKWVGVLAGKRDRGGKDCPLCWVEKVNSCDVCPVQRETGEPLCIGTPYCKWLKHHEQEHRGGALIIHCPECASLAWEEKTFLEGLLRRERGKVVEAPPRKKMFYKRGQHLLIKCSEYPVTTVQIVCTHGCYLVDIRSGTWFSVEKIDAPTAHRITEEALNVAFENTYGKPFRVTPVPPPWGGNLEGRKGL